MFYSLMLDNRLHVLTAIITVRPLKYLILCFISEPVFEKTNNLESDQVRHKPACTVIEDG